jgi:hypothetical protein
MTGPFSSDAAKRRWNDLSSGQRGLLVAAASVEGLLKIAMLLDLRHRPASAVRGPKWAWASTAFVGSAGLAQIAYFLLGRRHDA